MIAYALRPLITKRLLTRTRYHSTVLSMGNAYGQAVGDVDFYSSRFPDKQYVRHRQSASVKPSQPPVVDQPAFEEPEEETKEFKAPPEQPMDPFVTRYIKGFDESGNVKAYNDSSTKRRVFYSIDSLLYNTPVNKQTIHARIADSITTNMFGVPTKGAWGGSDTTILSLEVIQRLKLGQLVERHQNGAVLVAYVCFLPTNQIPNWRAIASDMEIRLDQAAIKKGIYPSRSGLTHYCTVAIVVHNSSKLNTSVPNTTASPAELELKMYQNPMRNPLPLADVIVSCAANVDEITYSRDQAVVPRFVLDPFAMKDLIKKLEQKDRVAAEFGEVR